MLCPGGKGFPMLRQVPDAEKLIFPAGGLLTLYKRWGRSSISCGPCGPWRFHRLEEKGFLCVQVLSCFSFCFRFIFRKGRGLFPFLLFVLRGGCCLLPWWWSCSLVLPFPMLSRCFPVSRCRGPFAALGFCLSSCPPVLRCCRWWCGGPPVLVRWSARVAVMCSAGAAGGGCARGLRAVRGLEDGRRVCCPFPWWYLLPWWSSCPSVLVSFSVLLISCCPSVLIVAGSFRFRFRSRSRCRFSRAQRGGVAFLPGVEP